jgi:uncharacterized protein
MKVTTERLFADTYALIEIVGGNQNYKKYFSQSLATTRYNLIELYYAFLSDYGKETAEKYFAEWKHFLTTITDSAIKVGMGFKREHRKEKLSYVDCIGYALAMELGMKFLTGDEKFENKPNVEFVK